MFLVKIIEKENIKTILANLSGIAEENIEFAKVSN